MKHRAALLFVIATLVLIGVSMVPAGAGPTADPATASQIISGGFDVASIEQLSDGQMRLIIVAYPFEHRALEKLGAELRVWRNDEGKTAAQQLGPVVRVQPPKAERQDPGDVHQRLVDPSLGLVAKRAWLGPPRCHADKIERLAELAAGIAAVVGYQVDLREPGR